MRALRPRATRTRSGSVSRRSATSAKVCRELIIEARSEDGPFVDFYDFCERVDPSVLNKRTIESLIKAGGFDSLGHPRKGLLTVFEPIVDATLRRRRERDQGTMSLFDLGGRRHRRRARCSTTGSPIPDLEFDKSRTPARREGDARPLRERPSADGRGVACCAATSSARSPSWPSSTTARCAPSPASSPALQRKYTKRGDLMAHVRARRSRRRDRGDGVPEDDAAVRRAARRRRDRRDQGPRRRPRRHAEADGDGDHPARDPPRRRRRRCTLRVKAGVLTDERVGRLRELLPRTPATAPCSCTSSAPRRRPSLRLGDEFRCEARNGLYAELRVLFGADCIA